MPGTPAGMRNQKCPKSPKMARKGPAQLGHSGDEIFHVVLFKTVTSYRVLKTHRPWNAYKLSPQQVTASVVPSLKRI